MTQLVPIRPAREAEVGPATAVTTRQRSAVWGLALGASALPLIIHQELTGTTSLWPAVVQAGALCVALVVARRSATWRQLDIVIRWLLCLSLGWHLLINAVTGSAGWQAWQQGVPWVARGAVVQALIVVPTVLLVFLGPGRRSPAALRLIPGDDGVRASADITTAGRRPTWRRKGVFWCVGVTAGTLMAMTFALGGDVDRPGRLFVIAPIIAVLAATNTLNEEFQFRNAPLGTLPALIGKGHALLLTGVVFGLEHFYGNPPAASGVLLASFLGYLLGKSMLETGGSKWAWIIHWLQDVVIFTFLALSWPA